MCMEGFDYQTIPNLTNVGSTPLPPCANRSSSPPELAAAGHLAGLFLLCLPCVDAILPNPLAKLGRAARIITARQ